jgi:hypothetical protein
MPCVQIRGLLVVSDVCDAAFEIGETETAEPLHVLHLAGKMPSRCCMLLVIIGLKSLVDVVDAPRLTLLLADLGICLIGTCITDKCSQ